MGFETRTGVICGAVIGSVLSCSALAFGITPLRLTTGSLFAVVMFCGLCAMLRRVAAYDPEDGGSEVQALFTAAFCSTGVVALLAALTVKLAHTFNIDLVGASLISTVILLSYVGAAFTFMRSTGGASMFKRRSPPPMRRQAPSLARAVTAINLSAQR